MQGRSPNLTAGLWGHRSTMSRKRWGKKQLPHSAQASNATNQPFQSSPANPYIRGTLRGELQEPGLGPGLQGRGPARAHEVTGKCPPESMGYGQTNPFLRGSRPFGRRRAIRALLVRARSPGPRAPAACSGWAPGCQGPDWGGGGLRQRCENRPWGLRPAHEERGLRHTLRCEQWRCLN